MTTTELHTIAFSRGVPPPSAIPSGELAGIAASVLADGAPAIFQYAALGGNLGDPALRAELARRYAAEPDEVFVGNGSLQVLDLLATRLLARAADDDGVVRAGVVVEAPTYDRARAIFERHGGRLVPVPVDGEGLSVDLLAELLDAGERVSVVYTIPDFQNPSGVTMSERRRRALISLAAEHDLTVIEDSPYRELRYHGAAPPRLRDLAAATGAGVITLSSLSKVLSPGLRVGYAVADHLTISSLARAAEATYLSPAPFGQAVAARAMAAGLVERNVAGVIDRLRPLHDHAVGAVAGELGDVADLLSVPGGGYFLGLHVRLGAGVDEAVMRRRAGDLGLAIADGSGFGPAPPPGTAFVRVPFQSMPPEDLREGLRRLRRAAA